LCTCSKDPGTPSLEALRGLRLRRWSSDLQLDKLPFQGCDRLVGGGKPRRWGDLLVFTEMTEFEKVSQGGKEGGAAEHCFA
jgi:hypothetical protein